MARMRRACRRSTCGQRRGCAVPAIPPRFVLVGTFPPSLVELRRTSRLAHPAIPIQFSDSAPHSRGTDSARDLLNRLSLFQQRVWGMPGARCTRSPCALVVAHGSHHESTGTPGIPARNGFNGFLRALPGDEFLFVTVASGLKICLSPVGPTHLRQLDISNGCQDHTTSPYAATSTNPSTGHVLPAKILTEALKRRSSCALLLTHGNPPCEHTSRARRCRVHRIPSRVRDDRDTPLVSGWDGAGCRYESGQAKSGIFLRTGLDGANHLELAQQIGVFEQLPGVAKLLDRKAHDDWVHCHRNLRELGAPSPQRQNCFRFPGCSIASCSRASNVMEYSGTMLPEGAKSVHMRFRFFAGALRFGADRPRPTRRDRGAKLLCGVLVADEANDQRRVRVH
jgi:hypothetical protein